MAITGNTIQSLPPAASLNRDDIFIVSTRDKYVSTTYQTCKASTRSLMKYFADCTSSYFGLKSMSHAQSSDYSPAGHSHNSMYNNLSVKYNWHPGDELSSALSIGNIFLNGQLSTLYVPMSCCVDEISIPEDIVEPVFGQLKFAAKDSILDVDESSDDFDGWLYPDGTTVHNLTCTSMSSKIDNNVPFIKAVDESAQTFVLNALSDFINIDCSRKAFSHILYENALKNHFHYVDFDISGNAVLCAYVPASRSAGPGGYLHQGTGKSTWAREHRFCNEKWKATNIITAIAYGPNDKKSASPRDWREVWGENGNCINFEQVSLSARCNMQISAANALSSAEIDIETYPNYTTLPVMVYVGRRHASKK